MIITVVLFQRVGLHLILFLHVYAIIYHLLEVQNHFTFTLFDYTVFLTCVVFQSLDVRYIWLLTLTFSYKHLHGFYFLSPYLVDHKKFAV